LKILLIEDDATTVETIGLCMEIYSPGSDVVAIAQGLAAIEKLKSDAFDIVLVDLGLPDIDGLQVLKEIRKSSNVPVLIVSARHNLEAQASAKDLGANDFITKPFDFRSLVKRIGEVTAQASP
jgi:DNA-binding response OmpR family regulator